MPKDWRSHRRKDEQIQASEMKILNLFRKQLSEFDAELTKIRQTNHTPYEETFLINKYANRLLDIIEEEDEINNVSNSF